MPRDDLHGHCDGRHVEAGPKALVGADLHDVGTRRAQYATHGNGTLKLPVAEGGVPESTSVWVMRKQDLVMTAVRETGIAESAATTGPPVSA